MYRNVPMREKDTNTKFNDTVTKNVEQVAKKSVREFSNKSRTYMQAYNDIEDEEVRFNSVERYLERYFKRCKTHKSVYDLDRAYIEKVAYEINKE